MGKVKVTNGQETFEIDGGDLDAAVKDGFKPTERIIVANSRTKESYEVDPQDVQHALKDGFSYQDIAKKQSQPVQQQAPQPVFQVNISQPTFKSAPVATPTRAFTDQAPPDELGPAKLQRKAEIAHQALQVELQGNRDVKENMIKQRRFEQAARAIPLPKSDMPKTAAQLTAERVIPPATKPQDLPVTDEDIANEDMNISQDRGKAVRLMEETMKKYPEKAKEIQKNLYTIDAFNSLQPDQHDRVPKIEENAKQVAKGNYVYDARSGRLIQPLGLLGSAIEGWKQDSKLAADYDFLKNAGNNSDILNEYHKRQKELDIDKPIPVPKGRLSELSQMLGALPLKPLAAGAIGSLGGPEAGGAAATLVGGRETQKREYAGTFWQTLDELIKKGVPENEAVDKARGLAEKSGQMGAITGAAMGLVGAKVSELPLAKPALSNSFKQAAFNVLKQTGSTLGKAGLEGLAVGGLGAAGQYYKNKLAQEAGINRPLDEGLSDQMESGLLMTVAMAAAIKGGRGISKMNYRNLLHGLSQAPEETINSSLQQKVDNGEITQKAADETTQRINDYKEKDSQIPSNVTEEARFKIQDNIDKINELEKQKEATHKSLQEPIKEKIQKLTDENLVLSKETEKPIKSVSGLSKDQEKEATELAEEWLHEGIIPEAYENAIKKDPLGFWKFLSQQAHNTDENWRPNQGPSPEQGMREDLGDTVVDYAKELFPAPEVKETPKSVSVIQPGEIQRPEAVTIGAGKVPPENIGHVEVTEHGEDTKTEAGQENGVQPSKLSESGRKEAEELGQHLIDTGKKKVITSEVERAQETAKIAAEKANIPVETNPVLNTWNIGKYDGKPEGSFVEEAWINKPNEAPEGGESFNDFTKRMEQAYQFVKSLPEDNHVISHSKVMRALEALKNTDGKWTDETTKDFLTNKELSDALQISSSGRVLQHPQEGTGIEGGERGGMEPSQQGEVPTGTRPEEINQGKGEEKVEPSPKEEMFDLPFKYDEGDDELTSIKNATTAKKVEEYGLTPAVQEAARKHGEVWQEAIQKVKKGFDTQGLVNQLKRKPRPLTDTEDALLLIHQIEKEAAYDAINKEINEAGQKGDYTAMDEAKIRRQSIKDDLQDLYDIDKKIGTLNARGLSARQMMADRRYSLVNMEQEMQASQNGKPLTDEQRAEVQKDYENIKATKDAYAKRIVELEQENQKLRQQAIEKKIKRENKKETIKSKVDKIKDDLKSNIDELRKIARDQGLGANPIALEALPVILKATKNLAKLGIVKIEQMAVHIYDAIKDQYGDELTLDHVMEAIEAANNQERLNAYKARKQKSIDAITEKLNTENAPQKQTKPPLVLDAQAMKLKALEERAKAAYDEKLKKQELRERTPWQKTQDTFVKWQRAFKLSGITTLGKLSGAGITRLITSPIEEGVGAVYSAVIPKLARRAEGEAGFNIKAEAKAITSAFTKGIQDAAETIKLGTKGGKGKSDLDIVFGKKDALPPEAIDFFGQLHSAIKAPIKRAAFERAFEKRIAHNIKYGVDVSDPMVQTRIAMEAYKAGQRAIFMQDNFVSDSYRNWVNLLEKSQKYPTLGKGAATFFQWMVPFVKVPTNIVGEVGTHVAGVPMGAAKLLHASFTKGIENLSPEEADMVMRNLKKGSVGIAALLIGYFNPNNFGGYYQKYEKRDEGDIQAGEAKIFGVTIPKWLLHSPIYETMQLGATVRRAKDKMVHGIPQGMTEGMWAGALGLAEEEPLLDQPMRFAKMFESERDRKYYLGELAKSTFDPILLQNVAKWMDPKEKRKPETIWEHIETGIPGLRENVKEKGGSSGGAGATVTVPMKPSKPSKPSKPHRTNPHKR